MQMTAYEVRISDWISDVCSSDLAVQLPPRGLRRQMRMTALDREPRKAEYTDLLADEQAGGDAEWHRLHQRLQIHAGKRHTGVGKTEDRDRKSTRLNSSH